MESYSSFTPLLILFAVVFVLALITQLFRSSVQTVREGERGLVYRHGRFAQDVGPGQHYMLFGREMQRVATNEQTMMVSNQEILTSDRMPVRATAIVTYKITNPRRAVEKSRGGYYNPAYYAAQLALRDVAAEMSLETFVDARTKLDALLAERARPAFANEGCELISMTLRDVVLPAEVRRLATEVTRARLEGLAALERARGEQTALRALANAARLVKGNPELMNLRVLQALGGQPGKTAPTVILGGATGIVPVSGAPGSARPDDGDQLS